MSALSKPIARSTETAQQINQTDLIASSNSPNPRTEVFHQSQFDHAGTGSDSIEKSSVSALMLVARTAMCVVSVSRPTWYVHGLPFICSGGQGFGKLMLLVVVLALPCRPCQPACQLSSGCVPLDGRIARLNPRASSWKPTTAPHLPLSEPLPSQVRLINLIYLLELRALLRAQNSRQFRLYQT